MRRAQNLIEEIESTQRDDILERTLQDLDDESFFDREDYDLSRVRGV